MPFTVPTAAHAHGDPLAITAVISADERGPWLVQLTEGFAFRADDGWRFVCPATFGIDGVALAHGSGSGGRAFVVGAEDLYRIDRDGQITPARAPQLGGLFVLALASSADDEALYGLRVRDEGGTQLLGLDPAGVAALWSDATEWQSIAVFRDELWLAQAQGRGVQFARLSLDGALVDRGQLELEETVHWVELRAAGDRLFAVAVGDDGDVLYELDTVEPELIRRWVAATAIHGPVMADGGAGAPWIIADGDLVQFESETREPISGMPLTTCLGQGPVAAYACVEEHLFALGAAGLEAPLFDISELTQPLPGDQCATEWQVFRGHLDGADAGPGDEPAPEFDAGPRLMLSQAPQRPGPVSGCSAAPRTHTPMPHSWFWIAIVWSAWTVAGRRGVRARERTTPRSVRLKQRRRAFQSSAS